uniref:Uncharacterized protein n=1 Tax=Anguilla anguilla TaxID=7936 RepID=A0A0E9V8Q8_ANGAN
MFQLYLHPALIFALWIIILMYCSSLSYNCHT